MGTLGLEENPNIRQSHFKIFQGGDGLSVSNRTGRGREFTGGEDDKLKREFLYYE